MAFKVKPGSNCAKWLLASGVFIWFLCIVSVLWEFQTCGIRHIRPYRGYCRLCEYTFSDMLIAADGDGAVDMNTFDTE